MDSEVSGDQSTEAVHSIRLRSRQNRAAYRDARSMRRIIVKQGYLKKLPNSTKLGSSFKVIMTCFVFVSWIWLVFSE